MNKKKCVKQMKTPSFFGQVNCACKNKCFDKIDIVRQKEIFDEYNSLTRSQKVLFMRKIVVQRRVGKENLNPIQLKKREFCCDNYLVDDKGVKHKVCQTFVLKLLQVPRTTLFRAVNSAKVNPNAIDKRGKYPAKRVDSRGKAFIKQFISELPVYESKYNRSASSAKFLHPGINVKQIYLKYKEKCSEIQQMKKVLSLALFTQIFNKEFDLMFFKTLKKTCLKCVRIDSDLKKQVISINKRIELTEEKDKHLNLVRSTVKEFFDVVEQSQSPSENFVVFSFKLGTPIDIPSINLVKDVTKRRIWLHNFCVYNETSELGFIYVWPEFTAMSGSQEIGSCLIRHLSETLPKDTKKVIFYSQSNKGQNRNAKISLMLKKFLHSCPSDELKTIEQRFFVNGHGYTKCDECLETIQNLKKTPKEIWTSADWLIQMCQEKNTNLNILINEMHAEHFLSSKPLENLISSRKISSDNNKIQWPMFTKIIYEKENPFGFQIATSGLINEPLAKINFQKRHTNANFDVILPILYPNGRAITKKKFHDLQDLLEEIPAEFHTFYNELKYANNDDDKDYALCSRQSSDEEEEEEAKN